MGDGWWLVVDGTWPRAQGTGTAAEGGLGRTRRIWEQGEVRVDMVVMAAASLVVVCRSKAVTGQWMVLDAHWRCCTPWHGACRGNVSLVRPASHDETSDVSHRPHAALHAGWQLISSSR